MSKADIRGAATHAIWHDPTTYDPYSHGPPYLLGIRTEDPELRMAKKASLKASSDLLGQMVEMASAYASPYASLAVLLACLRSVASVHQAHHWQTSGQAFYADHLLYDRLYTEALDGVDQLAERTVGLGGGRLVDPALQATHTAIFTKAFCPGAILDPALFPTVSLRAEEGLLVLLKVVRDGLERAELLTLGTDNLLQGLADKHESLTYLLQQRAGL